MSFTTDDEYLEFNSYKFHNLIDDNKNTFNKYPIILHFLSVYDDPQYTHAYIQSIIWCELWRVYVGQLDVVMLEIIYALLISTITAYIGHNDIMHTIMRPTVAGGLELITHPMDGKCQYFLVETNFRHMVISITTKQIISLVIPTVKSFKDLMSLFVPNEDDIIEAMKNLKANQKTASEAKSSGDWLDHANICIILVARINLAKTTKLSELTVALIGARSKTHRKDILQAMQNIKKFKDLTTLKQYA